MAYSDKVIDHYENPRNVGKFDDSDESIGTGMVGAPACGDVMRLQIKVNDEGVIEDAKFKTYCFELVVNGMGERKEARGSRADQKYRNCPRACVAASQDSLLGIGGGCD
jgi:nitrogen fixation NifU-like protein